VATDGETEAADGETEAADGKAKAADGETEAADGETVAADGETVAADGETEAADGEADAADGESEAADGETEAADGETEAADGDFEAGDGENEAGDGEAKTADGDTEAADGDTGAADDDGITTIWFGLKAVGDGLEMGTAEVVVVTEFDCVITMGTETAAAMPPNTKTAATPRTAANHPGLSPMLAPTSPNHPSAMSSCAFTGARAKGSITCQVPLTKATSCGGSLKTWSGDLGERGVSTKGD